MPSMELDPEGLKTLASYVKLRRKQLGLTRVEAARKAEMSDVTWHRVEEGTLRRPTTYDKIEHALDWTPSSCQAVLAGGEPTLWQVPDVED